MKSQGDWPVLTAEERKAVGLPRRTPKFEVTVAALYSEVLPMWDESNPFGPHDVASTSAVKIKWVCPAGHRFIESAVVQCGAASAWRKASGGSRACLQCSVGLRPDVERLPCGHAAKRVDGAAEATRCWECKRQEERERSARARSEPRYALGALVQSRSRAFSKMEDQVREKLIAAGIPVHKGRSAIQCGHDPKRGNFPLLTPDILVSKSKVCVEVDPAYTHSAEEDKDRTRNDLLSGVGWQVVRLRLGGLAPIGEHDVCVESDSITNEAIESLVDAISDAVAGRPGHVRRVQKKTQLNRREKSRLGAIAEHQYYENAFYVSWTLESGRTLRMVAMNGGSYLAVANQGWGAPHFIRTLSLHTLSRKQWRGELVRILEDMEEKDFEPVSVYPWGDHLFIGNQVEALNLSNKFNPGASSWSLNASLADTDSHTETEIRSGNSVLVQLHPEAVGIGWRIAWIEARSSRYGEYQQIQLNRVNEGSSAT